MATRILQTKFNQGELSPEMLGRSDVEQYYGGAETLQNVVIIPQGGVKRRDGLELQVGGLFSLNDLTPSSISAVNGGTTANANDFDSQTVLLTTTNVSTTNPYVVVQYDMGSDVPIQWVGVSSVFLTVSGTSTGDFLVQVATAAAPTTWASATAMNLTTTGKSHIFSIGGGSWQHVRFVKNTGTDLSTNRISLTEMTIYGTTATTTNTRLIPFEFNKEQTYIIVISDKMFFVLKDGALQERIPAPEYTSTRISEINWTQSADTAILVHEDIPPHKLVRVSDTNWLFNPIVFDNIPIYDFTPTASNPAGTITPSATDGVITLTASGTPFTNAATDVHQIVDGGGGRARVIEFLTTATVKAVTLIPFYDTTAIANGAWVYEEGYANAWSTAQGWPKSCTFHDGRLWFGGSKQLPQTLWASKVGLFFDFDKGQIFDDDAIEVTLDTDQVNEIVNLFSQRTLQIFTSGAEFAVFQSTGIAITPTTIDIRRQTQEGSEKGVRPSIVEGATIYLKRGGAAILEFIFNDLEQAYTSSQLTVASSHLIITPIDMAIDRSNADNEASLLYIVNSDGTMAIGSILKGQNVSGFAGFSTTGGSGLIKSVAVDADGVWVVVERTIGAGLLKQVEKFNSSLLMDASFFASGAFSHATGITWLSGETIKLRVDGVNVSDVTVSDGTDTGSITAFADYSGTVAGAVLVTSAAHGLASHQQVTITGTTNYNATELVVKVDANTFYIIATWVSDDATGTWTGVANVVPIFPSSTTSVEFGYDFTPTIKDLPVEIAAQVIRAQSSFGKFKRVSGANLRLKSTSGIQVNGNEVTTPDYTVVGSNTSIANFTGIARVDGIVDYDETGQLTITQDEPNPMTLLAVSKEVNF